MANYYLPLLRDKLRSTGNTFTTSITSTTNSILNNNKNSNFISISKNSTTTINRTINTQPLNESIKNLGFNESLLTEKSKDNNNKQSISTTDFVANKIIESNKNTATNQQSSKINIYDCNLQATSSFVTKKNFLVSSINQVSMLNNSTPYAPDSIKKVF